MPEPAELLEVNAGLDREDHPRLEDGLIAAVEKRRLVAFEPDRMADVVRQVWTTIYPKETVIAADDQHVLPPMAVDRVHRHVIDGTTVLHMFTPKVRRPAEAAS
jgi:hypothetical protein